MSEPTQAAIEAAKEPITVVPLSMLQELRAERAQLRAEVEGLKRELDNYEAMRRQANDAMRVAIAGRREAEKACAEMRRLLSVPGCIDSRCDGNGTCCTTRADDNGNPEPEPTQCQWCDERRHALSNSCGSDYIRKADADAQTREAVAKFAETLKRVFRFAPAVSQMPESLCGAIDDCMSHARSKGWCE